MLSHEFVCIYSRCVNNKGKCEVLRIKDEYIWEFIEGQLFDFFQGREIGVTDCIPCSYHVCTDVLSLPVAVVVRDFYKKFYNSLGSVPNRCSVV
uniref:Uncharacterized protein n=1 Tax=Tanacetum cinerariifolium TaxID=118510 RepID=A0A699IC76_TANCI|nr:hypothetical protein [Tanacetum cinerariifolium]